MSASPYTLATPVCPVVMGVMLWGLTRDEKREAAVEADVRTSDVDSLRAEVDVLRSASRQAYGHGGTRATATSYSSGSPGDPASPWGVRSGGRLR